MYEISSWKFGVCDRGIKIKKVSENNCKTQRKIINEFNNPVMRQIWNKLLIGLETYQNLKQSFFGTQRF